MVLGQYQLFFTTAKHLLAEYAKEHNLLDEWEIPRIKLKIKKLAADSKKLLRLVNKAKLK